MTLEYAILADAAKVRDGLLFLLGGGITDVSLASIPGPLNASLAIMYACTRAEMMREHQFEIRFVDEDGQPSPDLQSIHGVIPAQSAPKAEGRIGAVLELQSVAITRPGTYMIDVLLDGRSYKQIPLAIHGPVSAAA